MAMPTIVQAHQIFEKIINQRNFSDYPFTAEQEQTFRNHCLLVAQIAQKIALASTDMNDQRAYVFGLLHDCGRIKDEYNEKRYHGLVGYNYMLEQGYPEIAKISLTHCFFYKDFDMTIYPPYPEDLQKCKELIKYWEYDEEDLLIQFADMVNDMGTTCSLEYRFQSISQRYHVPYNRLSDQLYKLNEIKSFFDKKTACDVYQLLEIDCSKKFFTEA